jgi:polysaccharide export outer membrane protein
MKVARFVTPVALALLAAGAADAQQPAAAPAGRVVAAPAPAAGVTPPSDYVIGPEDVLTVQIWGEEQMSGEVVVRPDGMITLKLLNDIKVTGLTPSQLRELLKKESARFLVETPEVTVTVKDIKSRFVTVLGEVRKQGQVLLNGPMRVTDVLGMAGGVTEFADKSKVKIIRDGKSLPFDYEAILNGRKLEQDILLQPGDKVTVPE